MRKLLLSVGEAISVAARGLFILTLFVIPWLYGGTRDWTVTVLLVALFAVAILWLLGHSIRFAAGVRGSPWGISPVLLSLVLVTAALGWVITSNPESFFDPHLFTMVPIPDARAALPGTVDQLISRTSMIRISALLLALLFSSYLAARPRWRRILLASLAQSAIAIAVLGIAQKITGQTLMPWEPERFSAVNFAMYRYHANAGAFLNLAWPLCAAFAIEGFRRKDAFVARALWLPGTIVILVGVGVNLSKGGHLVAVILLLVAGIYGVTKLRRDSSSRGGRLRWAIPLATGAVIFIGLLILVGHENGFRQWEQLFANKSHQAARVWAVRACLEMAQDRPWFGFGPGTFATVFPFYSESYGDKLAGVWRFAHCDYAQTLVEWGITGSVLWAALFFGGLLRAAKPALHRRRAAATAPGSNPTVPLLDAAICLSLLGVAIHAAFDFPLQISSIQLCVAVLLGCAWRSRPASQQLAPPIHAEAGPQPAG